MPIYVIDTLKPASKSIKTENGETVTSFPVAEADDIYDRVKKTSVQESLGKLDGAANSARIRLDSAETNINNLNENIKKVLSINLIDGGTSEQFLS